MKTDTFKNWDLDDTANALGWLFFAVSTYFTCTLFISWSVTSFQKFVYFALGVGLQGAAAVFFVYACTKKHVGWQILSFVIFALAITLSLSFTIGNQLSSNMIKTAENKKVVTKDKKFLRLEKELKEKSAQVKKNNTAIEKYKKMGRLTKGANPLERQNEKLNDRITEIQKKLDSYEEKPTVNNALYNGIAKFFGMKDVEKVKFRIFIMVAILLDIGGCALFAISNSSKTKARRIHKNSTLDETYTVSKPDEKEVEYHRSKSDFTVINGEKRKEIEGIPESAIEEIEEKPEVGEVKPDEPKSDPNSYPGRIETDSPADENAEKSDEIIKQQKKKAEEKRQVSIDKLKAYIHELFSKEKKNGSLVGQKTAARAAGIKDGTTIAGVHNFFKEQGFIRSDGQYSYPLMTQEEMINQLVSISSNNGNSGSVTVRA